MVPQILLLLATMAWGASFFLSKAVIAEVGVWPLLFWRFLIVSALALLIFPKHLFHSGQSIRRAGLVLSLFLFLTIGLQMLGMVTATASRASFLTALYVPLTPLMAFVILKAQINYRHLVVVAIAVLGSALMTAKDGTLLMSATWGDALLILGALAAAIHIVLVEKYARSNIDKSLDLGLWQFIFCFVFVGAFSLFFYEPGHLWNPISWSAMAWVSVVFNAVITTGFAFMVQIFAQKRVGSLKAALIFSLEAPFACLFAAIFLGEIMARMELFGAAFVFLASIIPETWIYKTSAGKTHGPL